MLSVRALGVSYRGAIRRLRGVAVDPLDRQVVSVHGSDGAGKTTVLGAVPGTLAGVGGAVEEALVRGPSWGGGPHRARPSASVHAGREPGGTVNDVSVDFDTARWEAMTLPTWVLRRWERRAADRARDGHPNRREIARLLAVRAVLRERQRQR
jgi:hypothetical protein